jgi:hypothetical protein
MPLKDSIRGILIILLSLLPFSEGNYILKKGSILNDDWGSILSYDLHQNAPIREKIQFRIYPDIKTGVAEVRFWYEGKLLDVQRIKNSDLKLVHF